MNRERVLASIQAAESWLSRQGPASQDLYDFWACGYGRWAKSVYYRNATVGSILVAPLVITDHIAPRTRGLVRRPSVFPIALAHYADALFRVWRMTGEPRTLHAATHMMSLLIDSGVDHGGTRAWGYPFDWETCFGTFRAGTPLITTMPYVYDCLVVAYEVTGEEAYADLAFSAASACMNLFPQADVGHDRLASAYTPSDRRCVVNASAYRGYVLADAGTRFGVEDWKSDAIRNLLFVLDTQHDDGAWPYAVDGHDNFVDNFHTCFVLKNLVRASRRLPDLPGIGECIDRGFHYYCSRLLDGQGLPVPFAVRPRLTLHDRDLYDYAEGVNLAVLMEDRGGSGRLADHLVEDLLQQWQCPDGHFRTRHTVFGWNTIPYHRWAQSQTMRALACYAERR